MKLHSLKDKIFKKMLDELIFVITLHYQLITSFIMKKIILLFFPFLFVPLLVYSIENDQYVTNLRFGDLEQKDVVVLYERPYNHFVRYHALVDGDTAVVIALRSANSDSLVGETVKGVPLREMLSYQILFTHAEQGFMNIGTFICKGDTISFDFKKNKIYLQDNERIKYQKWIKTVTSEGDTIETIEGYQNMRRLKLP